MKLVGTENAGYRIISSAEFTTPADEIVGVVIAERIKKVGIADFVTWEYCFYDADGNVPNFYWGHYFKSSEEAHSDFRERARILFCIDDRSEADDIKDKLYHFCDFFSSMADFHTEHDNRGQADEYTHKELGVMAVIESLGLVGEYYEWRLW